jgi:hypothetical protein
MKIIKMAINKKYKLMNDDIIQKKALILIHFLLLSLQLKSGRLSREINGRQEGIIHFTGDHSVPW